MKKRTIKVGIAAFLAALMALLPLASVTAFAAEEVAPVIVVSGMASFPLYHYTDEESKQVFAPEQDAILTALGKCIVPLGETAIKMNWEPLVAGAMPAVAELFGYIACDETGESLYDVDTKHFPLSVDNYPDDFLNSEKNDDEVGMVKALIEKIGGENVYFFNYDWRLDPLVHADALNAFINNVLEEKNCSKVSVTPASMGGTVILSYLTKYGSEKIDNLVMVETAFLGASVAGELFNKKIVYSTDTLMEYFYTFYQDEGFLYQTLFGLLSSAIDMSLIDINGTLDSLVRSLLNSMSDELYDEVLTSTFGTMPGVWALIPNIYYATAKTAMYPDGMNKVLEERLDKYQEIQLNAQELLADAVDSGVDLSFIASYGFVGFPTLETSLNQTDCLIDTYYESGRATCMPHGETFAKDYTPVGEACDDLSHNHVSTDGIIDASTCMFPEDVWFVKGNRHVGIAPDTQVSELMVWLTTSHEKTDVHSDERYPQFTKLNRFSGKLTSLTGDTIKPSIFDTQSGIMVRILNFLKSILEFVTATFAN